MTPIEYLEANIRHNKRECLFLGMVNLVLLSMLGWLVYVVAIG